MPPVAQASLKPELNSTTHVHQIYIKAEPGQIWDAITSPEWNGRYGYRGTSHYELKLGGFTSMTSPSTMTSGSPKERICSLAMHLNLPQGLSS